MDEKDNHVVGNWAWFILAVVVVFFILYGWFAPRAYGETLPLEEVLSVKVLPYCLERGAHDFRDGYAVVTLPPDLKRKVVYFLERTRTKEVAEVFRNAAAIVAVVWYKEKGEGYAWTDDVFYIPVSKNKEGHWCGGSTVSKSDAPQPHDEDVKSLVFGKAVIKIQ